jgi:hypothetical protein
LLVLSFRYLFLIGRMNKHDGYQIWSVFCHFLLLLVSTVFILAKENSRKGKDQYCWSPLKVLVQLNNPLGYPVLEYSEKVPPMWNCHWTA